METRCHLLPSAIIESLQHQTPAEQFKRDAEVWQVFLTTRQYDDEDSHYAIRQEIMRRIFTLLYSGMSSLDNYEPLIHLGKKNTQPLPDDATPLNLASLLSHGGRITFQVPEVNWDLFIKSLLGDTLKRRCKQGVIQESISSHDVKEGKAISYDPKTSTGKLKILKTNIQKQQFRMNLGLGLDDDGNAEAQRADGSHGQLLFLISPPKKGNPGIFLLGVETCGPQLSNMFGGKHTAKAKKNVFSPTGGLKFANPIIFSDYQKAGHVLRDEDGLALILPTDGWADALCYQVNKGHYDIVDNLIDEVSFSPYNEAIIESIHTILLNRFKFSDHSDSSQELNSSSSSRQDEGPPKRPASKPGIYSNVAISHSVPNLPSVNLHHAQKLSATKPKHFSESMASPYSHEHDLSSTHSPQTSSLSRHHSQSVYSRPNSTSMFFQPPSSPYQSPQNTAMSASTTDMQQSLMNELSSVLSSRATKQQDFFRQPAPDRPKVNAPIDSTTTTTTTPSPQVRKISANLSGK